MSFENQTTMYLSTVTDSSGSDGGIYCKMPETYVWKYVAPLLLVVGSVGNVLTIVAISCRQVLRSSTSSFYLIFLALADLLVLYSGLLVKALQRAEILEVWTSSDAGCKVGYFLMFFSEQFEAWVLVQLSLERLAAVFAPILYRDLFTLHRACCGILASAVVLVTINLHWFWTLRLSYPVTEPARPCCVVIDSAAAVYLIRVVWTWVDLILSSALPFVIMLAVNASIIIQLTCRGRKTPACKSRITGMTLTLLTINFTFLLLTGPLVVFVAVWPSHTFTNHLVFDIFEMMNYANYAINFLLYCVSGPRFRREFIQMFTKAKCCISKISPAILQEDTQQTQHEMTENRC